MHPDLADRLPRNKLDTDRAGSLVALGYPAVEAAIPELLEWMQDINWPVAQVLQPFLAGIGGPLAPHIRRILETDDDVWKDWVLRCIVAESAELRTILRPELERLAFSPKPGEKAEELDDTAREMLN